MPQLAARLIGGLGLIALAACSLTADHPPSSGAGGYRQPSQQIYSTAGLPIARLIGTWHQVAGFGAPQPCTAAPFARFAATAGGVQVDYDLCLPTARAQGSGTLASAGAQGRYVLPNLPMPIWVLWMDQDNRTMVIGTPNGQLGMILAKTPPSPDHLRAAREVLAWNGYDLTQFHQY